MHFVVCPCLRLHSDHSRAHNKYLAQPRPRPPQITPRPKTRNSWFWPPRPSQCVAFATTFPRGKQKTRNFPLLPSPPPNPAGAKPNILWAKIRRKVRWLLSRGNLARYCLQDLNISSRGNEPFVGVSEVLLSSSDESEELSCSCFCSCLTASWGVVGLESYKAAKELPFQINRSWVNFKICFTRKLYRGKEGEAGEIVERNVRGSFYCGQGKGSTCRWIEIMSLCLSK